MNLDDFQIGDQVCILFGRYDEFGHFSVGRFDALGERFGQVVNRITQTKAPEMRGGGQGGAPVAPMA